MVRRLIAVLMMAALVVVVYGTGGVAEANEPDYTDPDVLGDLILELEEAEDMQAAFLDLTPAGQQAVIDALFNDVRVDVEISTDEVGAKGSMFNALSSDEDCHAKRASRYAYAIVKSIKVWKYTSRTRWCFDGDEITNDPHLTTRGRSMDWQSCSGTLKEIARPPSREARVTQALPTTPKVTSRSTSRWTSASKSRRKSQ